MGTLAFAVLAIALLLFTQVHGVLGLALAFAVAYGWSHGVVTIVRGTVPEAIFGARGYGALLGRLARPQFIARAGAGRGWRWAGAGARATPSRRGCWRGRPRRWRIGGRRRRAPRGYAMHGGGSAAVALRATARSAGLSMRARSGPEKARQPPPIGRQFCSMVCP
ncbi:MAG: hypothetical protein IPJ62_05890 [Betaproteobacteria bacterium]|nr:hypothetical protein [Betaproteobacteria bacterium]